MSRLSGLRTAATWGAFGLLTGVGVTLAVVLVSGVSVADEAGAPLGVEVVSVTDAATSTPSSTGTPTPTPTSSNDVSVVPAPQPTEVEIDDHGGDRPDDKPEDNGGSGNSGSGSSGSGGGSDDSVDD
jgi:hypothetical protein